MGLSTTAAAGLVGKLNPKNKVDLTNPELTIIVEVIKAVCCVSVARDYTLYRKYNVQEVVKEDAAKTKTDANAAEQRDEHNGGEVEKDKEEEAAQDEEKTGAQNEEQEVHKDEGGGE